MIRALWWQLYLHSVTQPYCTLPGPGGESREGRLRSFPLELATSTQNYSPSSFATSPQLTWLHCTPFGKGCRYLMPWQLSC